LGMSLNDGDAVSPWLDQSGSGNDATQAVAANRPTLQEGVILDETLQPLQ